MVHVETSAALKDFEKYIQDCTKDLENMVRGWAYEFTLIASDSTPIGSDARLRTDQMYFNLYQMRESSFGIPIDIGYHQGAWRASTDSNIPMSPEIYSQAEVGRFARTSMQDYKLGAPVYIGAVGPGFESFVNGNNPQSRGGLTPDILARVFKIDLQKYMNKGKA